MTKTRQSLSIDLDSLFPGGSVIIGNVPIIILPLTLEQISLISKQITGLLDPLKKEGITLENFNTPKSLIKIVTVILDTAPLILEEVTNVKSEDIQKLPIEYLVQLVEKVIEVNFKAKEDLEKNFKSLAENFLPQDTPEPEKTPKKTKK